MDLENIKRINELTELSRRRELTEAEQAERTRRRDAYLKDFRDQMRAQRDNTVVEYPYGTRKPFRDAGR